jgi:proline iminopeptidase
MTMAVTINASRDDVWPWLVQLGSERGGWYSWDYLDNAGRPSAREVHPEWQDLAVGDRLTFSVLGTGLVDAYEVALLEASRLLGLYGLSDLRGRWLEPTEPRPSAYMEGFWGFELRELSGGRTRLVVGGYQTIRPRWVERLESYWLYPPVVWIMQARMLAVLRRNIQRSANRGARVVAATTATSP